MRDQTALRVDNEGLAALADLDRCYNIPDQLKIDLSDAHTSVPTPTGERKRHIGFGFASEIDRAVIDIVGHRVDEDGLLGKVGLAGAHAHGDTRYAQLFLAGGIELGELRDGLALPQESRGVET